MTTEVSKKKMGRPSGYTDAIAHEICDRIANGEALHKICQLDEMPSTSMVSRWLDERSDFRERYARAREKQADRFAAEIVTIADEAEDANIARLRVDARKWAASKLAPKKYGDKLQQEITGADGGALKFVVEVPAESADLADWSKNNPA
jgi:hypothetical protein